MPLELLISLIGYGGVIIGACALILETPPNSVIEYVELRKKRLTFHNVAVTVFVLGALAHICSVIIATYNWLTN